MTYYCLFFCFIVFFLELEKFYYQRYRYFHKFDQGIGLDQGFWELLCLLKYYLHHITTKYLCYSLTK
mgnify:CR=1 FL=1